MESDPRLVIVFGLSWNTTEWSLRNYFIKYGVVLQTIVIRDQKTRITRGYGFVVFAEPSVASTVLQDKHKIDLKMVKVQRPLPKVENFNAGRNSGAGGSDRTNKIVVRGLPLTLCEGEFCYYFASYGNVTEVVVLNEQQTNQPRGFGVITYDSEDAVDHVLHRKHHNLGGKQVEVKRVLPKDGGGGGTSMGGSGGGCHVRSVLTRCL